jgi:hypothetical protein
MAHGHGGGHGIEASKGIAIFISVIALCLAIAETLAKGAQTNQISANVEASNLWSFFQAKTIRQQTLRTASEQMAIDVELARDPATKERLQKRISDWQAEIARFQSEPKTDKYGNEAGEGRIELAKRATELTKKRDVYANKYHLYEIASAVFQIALVLTSVYLLTRTAMLLYGSVALCALAFALMGAGLFRPDLAHLIH